MTRAENSAAWARRLAPGWLRQGRSYAGRIYLPSDSNNPDSRAVAAEAELSDSKLTATGATPEAGNFDTSPSIPLPVRGGEGVCRCGKTKKATHLVCNSCWFSSPPDVRHQLKRGDLRARRAALRLLLDAAKGRRVLREIASR